MFAVGVVAWVLVQPTEVLEQRVLLMDTVVSEAVTVRARYRADGGPRGALPAGVQGVDRPMAYAPGDRRPLDVQRDPSGAWFVDLPQRESSDVRVVARVVRPLRDAVLFQLEWPRVEAVPDDSPRADVPTRRVLELPRSALRESPAGWTCLDDPPSVVQCVSSQRRPEPLRLRLLPRPTRPWQWALAVVALACSLEIARRVPRGVDARTRLVGAIAGLLAGGVVSLALVGAHTLAIGSAVAACAAPGVVGGAFASASRHSSAMGALALLAIVGAVGAGVRATTVVIVAAVVAVLVVVVAARRLLQRKA